MRIDRKQDVPDTVPRVSTVKLTEEEVKQAIATFIRSSPAPDVPREFEVTDIIPDHVNPGFFGVEVEIVERISVRPVAGSHPR